jgi:glycosyltransferase involved in cell wall biosynthesis
MRDDVYAKSRVVLMPSEYESFGMVAAEAIVSGIPVIATPTAGLKENLGDAGIYARRGTGEVDKWYDALSKLLSDKAYYDEMSRKATAQSKVIDSDKELAAFVSAVEGLVK